MSTKLTSLVVGLTVVVTVSATVTVAEAGPLPGPSPALAAPSGPSADPARTVEQDPAPPSSSPDSTPMSHTVFLMSDGNVRVHDGEVVEDGSDYLLRLGAGEARIPKKRVLGRFGSLREVYEFRRDRLPKGDPDESMKLAQWCISHHLNDEAVEQLRAVLTWSPNDDRASAMLENLLASARRQAMRDEAVVRASATDAGRNSTSSSNADPAAPREMDQSVLAQIRAYKGPVDTPVVFDLPEALAVRRFQEFARFVHPVLQKRCAECHDEQSDRNFRLIRARATKDLSNTLLVRTNLDAALGLVDRSNPGHSPLLVNAVMPHCSDQKPILPDPNSAEYRALWTWIDSLRHDNVPATDAGSDPSPSVPGANPAAMSFGGGFASGRNGPIAVGQPQSGALSPASAMAPPVRSPKSTFQSYSAQAVHPSVPDGVQFQPISPLIQGSNPSPLIVNGQTNLPPGAAYAPAHSLTGASGRASAPAPRPGAPAPPMAGAPAPAPAPGQGQGPAPAAIGTPQATTTALPDGSQLITQPDGSQMLRLPDGTLAPVMDRKAVRDAARSDGQEKNFDFDASMFQQLQQRRLGGSPN